MFEDSGKNCSNIQVMYHRGPHSNGTENTLKRDRVADRVLLPFRARPVVALQAFGVADIPHDELALAAQSCSDQESSHVHGPAATGGATEYLLAVKNRLSL